MAEEACHEEKHWHAKPLGEEEGEPDKLMVGLVLDEPVFNLRIDERQTRMEKHTQDHGESPQTVELVIPPGGGVFCHFWERADQEILFRNGAFGHVLDQPTTR